MKYIQLNTFFLNKKIQSRKKLRKKKKFEKHSILLKAYAQRKNTAVATSLN